MCLTSLRAEVGGWIVLMVSAALLRAARDPEHAAAFPAITPRVALYTLDIRRVYPRPPRRRRSLSFCFCDRARRT